MAAVLLAAGTRGKRLALPNSRVILHQPLGGFQGQASDIHIQAQEILRMKERIIEILQHHTKQQKDHIERDCDRDFILTAQHAREYGLIDEVIVQRSASKRRAEQS
jgi:ATP-dependent Clp protease protease subunit